MSRQETHYSTIKLISMYFKKESKLYQQEGYKYARTVKNKDVKERLMAFLCDVSVMILPIFIWIVIMFLILAGVVTVTIMPILQIVTLVLLCISALFINPYISVKTKGQTIGRYVYHMKVVDFQRQEVSVARLVVRELFGFSIPFILLTYFFNLFGVFLYWILNGLFTLFHPKHLSIIDLFTRTKIVVLNQNTPVEKAKPMPTEKPVYSRYDLHLHSNFSHDGELGVEDIFKQAKQRGIQCISITDHNSVKANHAAMRMSELYGIDYIPGIELDCMYEGRRVHILGYFIQYNADIYAHIENENLMNEKKAGLARVQRFEEFSGLKINTDVLLENNRFQIITGEMIARYVLHKPSFQKEPLLQPYLKGNRSDRPYENFYKDFFSYGAPCYVPIRFPSLKDALDVISLTGGISVLAHPGKAFAHDDAFIERLFDEGIEGIEVFTPYHDKSTMAKYLKFATERNLFITGGSNFHGKAKPQLQMGVINAPKEGEKLIQMFLETKS